MNVARALRFQANLPIYFWGESVLNAAHLINRTPTPLLQNKSPYEILFNTSPSYNTIRTFGCLCFAQNQKTKGDKFASRSRKCVFMGYPFGQKGWKLFDLDSKQFFVSRDVKFFEDVFPFLDPIASNLTPENIVPIQNDIHCDFTECTNDFYENIHSNNLEIINPDNSHHPPALPTSTTPPNSPTPTPQHTSSQISQPTNPVPNPETRPNSEIA